MMTNTAAMELNLDELAFAFGGSDLRNHPMYNVIKDFYKLKGLVAAYNLCGYYGIGNEDRWNMMLLIQEEVS